jgi:formate dehydrogenase subunit beta
MNVNRIVEVQNGDTLGALRDFLAGWWDQYGVDAMLAPCETPDGSSIATRLITDKENLSGVNPFAPVMLSNAARTASQFLLEHPAERLIVLLRPCELRALGELLNRHRDTREATGAVLVGVDCLGTLPPEEYFRMIQRSSPQEVTREALRNATTGGLRPQQFRTACQLCDSPAPRGADLVIGTLGVETQQCLLFIARDEETARRLGLATLIDIAASEYQVSHRETVAGAVADLRTAVRKSRYADLKEASRFDDLGRLLAWFARCDLCGKCLEACPVYEGELDGFFGRTRSHPTQPPPLAGLAAVGRWLAACSGCGICEQNCERKVPLTPFLSALNHSIREEMGYVRGEASFPFS